MPQFYPTVDSKPYTVHSRNYGWVRKELDNLKGQNNLKKLFLLCISITNIPQKCLSGSPAQKTKRFCKLQNVKHSVTCWTWK